MDDFEKYQGWTLYLGNNHKRNGTILYVSEEGKTLKILTDKGTSSIPVPQIEIDNADIVQLSDSNGYRYTLTHNKKFLEWV